LTAARGDDYTRWSLRTFSGLELESSVNDLRDRLAKGVVVADGAMGSMIARAFSREMPVALAHTLLDVNLSHPEIVHSIHLAYLGAGAEVIETNTFGASRSRLERLGLGNVAERVVSEAVKIARQAREASGRVAWIAGSISPLDADWLLDVNPDAATQGREFEVQADLLLDRGVDLLVIETFSRLSEMLLALEAVRRVSRTVPIVAQMSFDDRGCWRPAKPPISPPSASAITTSRSSASTAASARKAAWRCSSG
jgi:homocysteine S-methyltransferase